MKKNLYIFGCSGIGKSICDSLSRLSEPYDKLIFIDDEYKRNNTHFYNFDVLSYEELHQKETKGHHAIFAFFKPKDIFDRHTHIKETVSKFNLSLTSIIDPSAAVSNTSNIGVGCYIAPNVVVDSDSWLGDNCIVLFNSVISREVKICENCFISAGSVLKGSIVIEASSFISANTCITKNIYKNTFVNAGVILTEEIHDSCIVGMEKSMLKLNLPKNKTNAQKRLRFLHP